MSFFSLITGSFRDTHAACGMFIHTEPYEEGFTEHYTKHIKPHVSSFEELRMQALESASKRTKSAIPLMVLVLFSTIFLLLATEINEYTLKFAYGVIILSFGAASWWIYSSINQYKASIKSDIFPNILSFLGNYTFSPECPNRVYGLRESDIIPDYDRETNEDMIIGKYKDVDIDLFETTLEVIRRQKRTNDTVFKGVVISLSMHKYFKGKTIIKKDAGVISNLIKNKFTNLENVTLEDPHFEEMFEVYSSDQIESRYLLTPAFMERLVQLSEAFRSTKIECSFYDNKLLMLIPITQNLFEPGSIFEPEDFVDDAKTLLKEMNLIFQIIDILKLDQNIGM